MRKVLANPAVATSPMVLRCLIQNDQELAVYTETLFELTALDKPSRALKWRRSNC